MCLTATILFTDRVGSTALYVTQQAGHGGYPPVGAGYVLARLDQAAARAAVREGAEPSLFFDAALPQSATRVLTSVRCHDPPRH
jgi:hypothetical protein